LDIKRPCLRKGRFQSRYFAFNKRPHFKRGRYHRLKYLVFEDHKKQTKVEAFVVEVWGQKGRK
jgi:hypothetical protein